MPSFSYIGFSDAGMKMSGTLVADSDEIARKLLKSSGLKILALEEQRDSLSFIRRQFLALRSRKLNLERFFSDLAALMGAGLNLDFALKAIAADSNAISQHKATNDILEQLTNGKAPSEAFRSIDHIQPDVVALILSGEQTGRLSVVFAEIARQLERNRLRRQKIIEAIIYPAFLIVMIIIALLIVTFFLVPAILPLFEGTQKQPPFIISALDTFRKAFVDWVGITLALSLLILFASLKLVSLEKRNEVLSHIILGLPALGSILRKHAIARYLQTLSLLLQNGVEMRKSLSFAAAACPVPHYRRRLESIRDEVINGRPLSEALGSPGIFPSSVVSLASIGDQINALPSVLARAGDILEGEANGMQTWFLTLLTPAITILMGAIIGGLVVTVMSAVLSINELGV